MYHYSSQLTLDAEDLALFNDEDFSKISGLHQVRWASSQARALSKLDNNFFIICMHLENVAASNTQAKRRMRRSPQPYHRPQVPKNAYVLA